MELSDARIYSEGICINHDTETRILQIVSALKAKSPSSEISMHLAKNGEIYEGLMWGKARNKPLGVFKHGTSLNQVLEHFYNYAREGDVKASNHSKLRVNLNRTGLGHRSNGLLMTG